MSILPRDKVKELGLELSEGIVVMLDALGARNYNEEEVAEFIIKRELLLKSLEPTAEAIYQQFQAVHSKFVPTPLPKPDVNTFGDTIVFTWSLPAYPDKGLVLASMWTAEAISKGMEIQLPLRGAIAHGKFLCKGATILGPAVADAAAWYEKAQWLGVIATPSSSIQLEFLKDKFPLMWFSFMPYNVPLKGGGVIPTWAVAWPWTFIWKEWEQKSSIPAREEFLATFKQFKIPPFAANKYYNTLNFFDNYLKYASQRHKEYMEAKANQSSPS